MWNSGILFDSFFILSNQEQHGRSCLNLAQSRFDSEFLLHLISLLLELFLSVPYGSEVLQLLFSLLLLDQARLKVLCSNDLCILLFLGNLDSSLDVNLFFIHVALLAQLQLCQRLLVSEFLLYSV